MHYSVYSVSLQTQESVELTRDEHRLINNIVAAHQKYKIPLEETKKFVCVHYWQKNNL